MTDLNKNVIVTRYDIANIKINFSKVADKADKIADKVLFAISLTCLLRQVSEIAMN